MNIIQFAIVSKLQLYSGFLHIGTLGMSAKTKKDIRQKSLESAQALTLKKNDVQRCITGRAMLKDDMCTMKLHVYMLHNNEWYLHSNSCLNHCNHPPSVVHAWVGQKLVNSNILRVLRSDISVYFHLSDA